MNCFFVTDLHGSEPRFQNLLNAILRDRPEVVFWGGDILPPFPHQFTSSAHDEFISEFLIPAFATLRQNLGDNYPRMFLILGNDDPKVEESALLDGVARELWEYIHGRHVALGEYRVLGYNCVPPTPFALKDWERYDVSRFVDVGCISPEEGYRTVPVEDREKKYATITAELEAISSGLDFARAICLFHAPPYQTCLDHAALSGKTIDMVPLDVHVGSVAIRRFIERHHPLITLHGHVHESTRLTGAWRDQIGDTVLLSAAHDGPELALVKFDPLQPALAIRELV